MVRGRIAKKTMPVARGAVVNRSKPRQTNLPNGNVLVAHRELVTTVHTYSAFTAQDRVVQPALLEYDAKSIFKWLNHIARRYETYRFRRLSFEFVPQCATSTEGINLLYFDHDPKDGPPVDMSTASRNESAVSFPCWSPAKLVVDCSRTTPLFKYTRARLSNTTDIRMTDAGRVWIVSEGGDNGYSGNLYVSYEIELRTPQISEGDQSQATMGGTYEAAATPHPVATGADDRVEMDPNMKVSGTTSILESLGVHATGAIGAFRCASGLWRAAVEGTITNSDDVLTDCEILFKRAQPSTEGDDAGAEALLDVTGSGADLDLERGRYSFHNTATPSSGLRFRHTSTFYTSGTGYFAPYLKVTTASGTVTLNNFRVTLMPLH